MRTTTVTLPELALVAPTRGMAGAGAGLLVAERIGAEKRKTLGWTLFLIGVLSTIPLALQVFGKRT
jgi:hypothetical protein